MDKRRNVPLMQEVVFVNYLYELLENGITDGITEDEFNHLVNNITKEVNSNNKLYTLDVSKEPFKDVINKVNLLHSDKKNVVKLINMNGIIKAQPTYDLYELSIGDYTDKLYCYKEILRVITRTVMARKKVLRKSTIEHLEYFPREIINIAKKIAAIYVNESIEMYVDSRIKKGYWPKQCKDVDEYIFKKDIGRLINEQGTSTIFERLYLNAIVNACEILKSCANQDVIMFSNYPKEKLAYSNFKRLFEGSEFLFLRDFVYNPYTLSKHITLTIIAESVSFASSYCAFSDPYVEYGDKKGCREKVIISPKHVEIMEKRIGKI